MLMKGVASHRKLWRDACSLWTRDSWMRLLIYSVRRRNAGNWNVLVPAGKEINWDVVSNSEWKQHKANWNLCRNAKKMWCYRLSFYLISGTWSYLERYAQECDSHVRVTEKILTVSWLLFTGYWIEIWEASTSNLKYNLSPIAKKYSDGMLKSTRDRK